ncbi:MAG: hypothetical protein LBC08_02265 [Campylobacteraceae bacterium]|nr:hypothetical protein [Campylobacteraceae bacterium]
MQTTKFKKSAFISSCGVGLILLGMFLLFLLGLHQYFTCETLFECGFRKSDFAHVNLQNIFIFTAFGTIFAGILVELRGVFLLSKAACNMTIFYNKLNLYFAISLFFALSLKNMMASSEHFFLIAIKVSHVSRSAPAGFIGDIAGRIMVLLAIVYVIFFLCKNSIYLPKVFNTIVPKNRFARWSIHILSAILSIFLSYFIFRDITIIVFLPYLLSLLVTYYQISKASEANNIAINKDSKVSMGINTAVIVTFIVMIIASIFSHFIASILFVFLVPILLTIPVFIILILESFNLTKTTILIAAIETIIFWILFFSPLYAALFVR